MKYAIIGSRNYKHLGRVALKVMEIAISDPAAVIVSGGATGVDTWARDSAKTWELKYEEFLPDFTKGYNVGEYHVRNDKIIEAADQVFAFWDGKSPGTKSVIEKCMKLAKRVEVIFD